MSQDQPAVDPVVEPPVVDSNPVAKKRSPVERAIVWGGILILLLVVGAELLAQRGYNGTMMDLENNLDNGATITEAELSSHIHGLAVRDEAKVNDGRTILLNWPSLFRTYKLRLPVGTAGELSVVETEGGYKNQLNEKPTEPVAPRAAVAKDN